MLGFASFPHLHRLQREMQASPIPVSPTAIRELVCDLDEQGVQDLVAELCSTSFDSRAAQWTAWIQVALP